MHSLKSTGIAVLLLAVSVGLYQFSANDGPSSNFDLSTELGVSDGSIGDANQQRHHEAQSQFGNQQFANQQFANPQFANPQFANPSYHNNGGQPLAQTNSPIGSQLNGHPFGSSLHSSGGQSSSPQFASAPNGVNGQLVSSSNFPSGFQQTAGVPNQSSQNQYPLHQQQGYPGLAAAGGFQNNAPQISPASPAGPPAIAAAPDFEALRSKFNQTANGTVGAVARQADQQFANLQQQATAAGNQLSQSFSNAKNGIQQTVNSATENTFAAAGDYGNQLANDFQANTDSMRQNIDRRIQDFQQSVPDLAAATSATRQTIDTRRDDGLIDALQTELNSAAQNISIDSSSNSDFASPSSSPSMSESPEIKIGSNFNGNDFQPQLKAQPIELNSDAENRLVSEQTPFSTDFNVQQANIAPQSLGNDANAVANIDQAWVKVQELIDGEKFRDALIVLTRFYRSDDLTSAQRTKLNDWLDALAGKVIYSTENHFTSTTYRIKAGETLAEIATRWNVPAQVVYNINRKQIGNNPNVAAGTELKMINGPFHAEVDMSNKTLTLFLKDLYAGRFPVTLGISGNPRPGDYNVVAKSVQGHTWRDADGNDFPPDAPENGYGPYWIGMTGSLCIHATDNDEITGHPGCIGLSEKDAKDIFGILANRSQVKVVP